MDPQAIITPNNDDPLELAEPFGRIKKWIDVVKKDNQHIFNSPLQCKTIRGSFICIRQEDLIKDNKQIHNGLVWYLTVITLPEKGMVFPEPQKFGSLTKDLKTGKKTESEFWDYGWSVVKAIDIPEEEQNKYPDPRNPGTFYKKRMDMKNKKRFLKLEFMDAAEELGMFGDRVKTKSYDNKNKSNK